VLRDVPELGLRGTENPQRVSVSLGLDHQARIIGHVLYNGSTWAVEGDPKDRQFQTPREAAEYVFTTILNPA
jgi:hypothetical protein